MGNCVDNEWLDARITKQKQLIEEIENAISALQVEGANSYTIDTGQTRTTVTRQNLATLNNALDSANARLDTLCQRRHGTGSYNTGPGF